jgi:hypothetical protein
MLKSTQGKEQQVPESSNNDKQVAQLELETPVKENTSQGTDASTSGVKEHHTIVTNMPKTHYQATNQVRF